MDLFQQLLPYAGFFHLDGWSCFHKFVVVALEYVKRFDIVLH